MRELKISFALGVLFMFLVIVPAGIGIYYQWTKLIQEFNYPGYELSLNNSSELSKSEKLEIDTWIAENGLNKYGDPLGTVYTGGTPLFNESTGQKISRYDYILMRHPDRPWRK